MKVDVTILETMDVCLIGFCLSITFTLKIAINNHEEEDPNI